MEEMKSHSARATSLGIMLLSHIDSTHALIEAIPIKPISAGILEQKLLFSPLHTPSNIIVCYIIINICFWSLLHVLLNYFVIY